MMEKVRVVVKPELVPDGEMYVLDVKAASIAYALGAPFIEEEEPGKIIVVHDKIDEFKAREAIEESEDMELVE